MPKVGRDVLCILGGMLALVGISCAPSRLPDNHTWRMLETEHVLLRTDARSRVARRATTQLERHVQLLRSNTFPCAKDLFRRQLQVTLFRHEIDYDLVAPPDTGAAYVTLDPGLTQWQPQILMHGYVGPEALWVFQHELTHHLVQLCHASAPTWLHEGLAQYLETARYEAGTLLVGVPRVLAWQRTRFGEGTFRGSPLTMVPAEWLPRPSQLVRMDAKTFYQRDEADRWKAQRQRKLHYAAAALLVHMLESAQGALAAGYQRYLAALAAGTPDATAFERAFDGLDLDAAFERSLDAESVPTFPIRTALPPVAQPAERILSSAERHAHLAGLWGWEEPERRRKAAHHVALGLSAAPHDASLNLMHIQLLLAGERPEAARRAAELWRSKVPDCPEALRARLAWSVMTPAGKGKECFGDVIALERLRALDDDAHNLDLAARCAVQERDLATAEAYLARAMAHDPLCARCHLTLALVRALDQNYAAAEASAIRAAQLAGEDSAWAWQAAEELREQIRLTQSKRQLKGASTAAE